MTLFSLLLLPSVKWPHQELWPLKRVGMFNSDLNLPTVLKEYHCSKFITDYIHGTCLKAKNWIFTLNNSACLDMFETLFLWGFVKFVSPLLRILYFYPFQALQLYQTSMFLSFERYSRASLVSLHTRPTAAIKLLHN